jgi:hypothetical protein
MFVVLNKLGNVVVFTFELLRCQLGARDWHSQVRKGGLIEGMHCGFEQVSTALMGLVCWMNLGLGCMPRTKTMETPHGGLQLCDM